MFSNTSCTTELILDERGEADYMKFNRDDPDNFCKVIIKNEVADTKLCVKLPSDANMFACIKHFQLQLADPGNKWRTWRDRQVSVRNVNVCKCIYLLSN